MSKQTAIGAFCTDIVGSTDRIESFREKALRQHRIYLETAGKQFLQNISKTSRAEYLSGDLWVPGDALWGILYPEPGKTYSESITASLGHIVYSLAYGLSAANSSQLPPGLDAITIRSVFLAGPIIRETIFDKLTLYNGTALNACGRLEKWAKPNTIIAGFVLSDDEPLFQSVARSPVIDANEVKECIMNKPKPRQAGYKVRLETVSNKGNELLRFVGWRTRRDLRGLVECRVLVTRIELLPQKQRGIEVISPSPGDWDREEVSLPSDKQQGRWELHELINTATTSKSLEFLKQIYEEGEIEIFVPSDDNKLFQLKKCHGQRFWPRIKATSPAGIRFVRTDVVDFKRASWCILPTHQAAISDNEKILIQAYDKNGRKVLCFSKVSDNLLNRYEDYADFLDSATPCVEFTFA